MGTWSCAECSPEQRENRGSCGNSFPISLWRQHPLRVSCGEQGDWSYEGCSITQGLVVVHDNVALRRFCEQRFTVCPLVLLRETSLSDVWRGYRMAEHGNLALLEPSPSDALLTAVDLLACEIANEQTAAMKV